MVKIAEDSFENKLRSTILNNAEHTPLVFDKVFFISGSASINSRSELQLRGTASILNSYETARVLLRGHTDSTGMESKNVSLSLIRSMTIKNRLVTLGVSPQRIQAEGVGSQKPIAKNGSKEGRKKNRRIELIVLDNSK